MRARRPPRSRASLALLIVLPVLAASAPTPDFTPLLFILRSACPFADPQLHSEHNLRSYATATQRNRLLSRPFRILTYDETCGENSSLTITRNSLVTLGAGGVCVYVGWPGAEACSAASTAAHAMGLPQPAACAATYARASVLTFLARRLHWRRALLEPESTMSSECKIAINQIESALLTAGVQVHRESLDLETINNFHVSVICNDQSKNKRGNIVSMVIILHIIDSYNIARQEIPLPTQTLNIVNATSDLDPYEETFPSPSSYIIGSHHKNLTYVLRHKTAATSPNEIQLNLSDSESKLIINQNIDKSSTISSRLYGLDSVNYLKAIVLADIDNYESNKTYDNAIDALRLYYSGKNTTVENIFQMYESKLVNGTPTWVPITQLITKSKESKDYSKVWETDVLWERTVDIDIWCKEHVAQRVEEMYDMSIISIRSSTATSGILCIVGAAVIALGAIGLTIFTTRRTLAKRMQRRPRAAVILAAADFQFPADEQRRVGEGMETMLTWLQQLHDLNGPEPDKPDLLKRPTAPSAPSSTCSVTRLPPDGRIRYKGDPVHMKYFPATGLELKRKAIDILLVMQSLRHENLNPFIGCLCEVRPALVLELCSRGSLEDVLVADDIRLDWTFRLSLLTDLVRGMRYLHGSPLRVHGRLTSRNCVVDSRWVLRITDYGVPAFTHTQSLPMPTRTARDLLWSAPELLRAGEAAQGTQAGDVFSFSIIMQEVIVRGEPYCMLALTPEEIIEKLCRPPPLIRPSVSMGAAPPEAVNVMRQCWSEQPDMRPDFNGLYEIFRHLHRGRKINIVDSMFEMLEKYSNNLEELIKERTEQLDMEKKKTEQLLNRMLPRSVAERLMFGLRVEPEEFEEVSIYFSDIVGFTAIAARSTPVQVVDLLNDLYTTFDAAIEQYRVYKVETIGDAYMVVGGLPIRCTDHAENVATMALHLLHLAGRFRIRHSPATPLHLRIGLHSGACCAGVVGLTMPRYCLFGDTVNTASRMESTGAAWRIQVSSATAERLVAAGGYRLRSRGLTQVKGKGAMHTYWLLGKDGFDKTLPTPPPLESEEVLFETEAENESDISDEPIPLSTQAVERQCSDPSSGGWQRSGALSADSSPPAGARYRYLRASLSTVAGALDTPRLSDRRVTSGTRVLRRQWSLERGDALAAAAAEGPAEASPAQEPLALRAPPPRAAPPRYRTRPDVSQSSDGER
ncbi:guanylate cyclase D [Zerene cesonia]|uniref:guanylate cyclase D n=1 Tax=Zerene cesonia TaxID=33412 RepID=UPI0018E4DC8D|nr:guanylate cyclase D [Zerene cesonia]